MSCVSCTKLAPITKGASSCSGSKQKLDNFRMTCCDNIIETISPTTTPACTVGYISDIISADVIGNPEPFFAIDIINKEDIDELDDFTYDRTTEVGEDTYSITLAIKVQTPEHQCTFESLKGQDICIVYRITGKDGNYVWRRFKGTVTAVTGGLIAGYQITIDNLNPDADDKPLFVNFGTAAATTAALDLLTQF